MNSFIASLDWEFAQLHQRSRELIDGTRAGWLYRRPDQQASSGPALSVGEYVLRSAATIEQTFGGLTANLWDDPFEWTLPETLYTPDKVIAYLDEVEATRTRGFELLKDDAELLKEIMSPSGNALLFSLLLDTLVRAAHYLGSAEVTFAALRD